MNYVQDDGGKWIVYMDDVVIRQFDTEAEASRYVNGDDVGTPEQDIRILEAYHTYFKMATGIDLIDPRVAGVDIDKITVDTNWHKECLNVASKTLTKDEQTMFMLYCVGKLPKNIPFWHGLQSNVDIEEGAVIYAEPTSAKSE